MSDERVRTWRGDFFFRRYFERSFPVVFTFDRLKFEKLTDHSQRRSLSTWRDYWNRRRRRRHRPNY